MQREDESINAKRVQRARREAGLQVRKRQRRMRRVGPTETKRRIARYPGEVRSWEFVSDQTAAAVGSPIIGNYPSSKPERRPIMFPKLFTLHGLLLRFFLG